MTTFRVHSHLSLISFERYDHSPLKCNLHRFKTFDINISQINEGLTTYHIFESKSQFSYSAVEASRPMLRFLEKFVHIQSGGNRVKVGW